MKIMATRKPDQNHAAVDPWTAVHLAAGLALGLVDVPMSWALGAAIGYEVAEQWLERREWGQQFFHTQGPESPPNAVVDVVVFYFGHRLGQGWNART